MLSAVPWIGVDFVQLVTLSLQQAFELHYSLANTSKQLTIARY